MIGLETALPLCLDLVVSGAMSPMTLFARMATAPARILGLPGGTLALGAVADITVVDPQAVWTCDKSRFRSKSRNSPFVGRTLRGRAILTIVGGNIVFAEEKILG